ncbi:MAG: hypothetical protein ABFE07_04760 [Armatimonadia bacterium]
MANIETVDIEHLPLEHDIAHQAGDAYRKLWTLERTATSTAAVALTDVTWALVIADAPSGGTAKLTKATTAVWTASGIYVDSAANGQFTVFVTAADIAASLPAGDYWYHVKATFPAGSTDFASMPLTLLAGKFTVLPALT